MVLRISWIIFLAFSFAACTQSDGLESQTYSSEAEAPVGVSGGLLFQQNCSNCHGMDGKLGNSGAKDLSQSTLTDAEIVKILEEGKNAMPPMAMLMENPSDMDSVIVFVKSLRR